MKILYHLGEKCKFLKFTVELYTKTKQYYTERLLKYSKDFWAWISNNVIPSLDPLSLVLVHYNS